MPRGKRAELKTPMAGYDAGCRVRSTSTQCPTRKSRTSSLPPISRPENAWASRPPSRRFSKSLAKTCVSGSHKPVALRSRIHVVPLFTAIFLLTTRPGSRREMVRSCLRLAAGGLAFVLFYFLLHPNAMDAITHPDKGGTGDEVYLLGFLHNYFIDA